MTKTKSKTLTYKGEELTEERAEQIADETVAELAAMTDEEVKERKRPGRPRLGAGDSEQIRVRVTPGQLFMIDTIADRQHQSRSEVLREALEEYISSRNVTGMTVKS